MLIWKQVTLYTVGKLMLNYLKKFNYFLARNHNYYEKNKSILWVLVPTNLERQETMAIPQLDTSIEEANTLTSLEQPYNTKLDDSLFKLEVH